MAIAYAQYILCGNQNGENKGNKSCNLKFKKSHPDLHFAYPTVTTEEVKKTQKY
jgi:DNA polymerase-3 subunit delta'